MTIEQGGTPSCTARCVTASLRFAAPRESSAPFVDRGVRIHDARSHGTPTLLDRNGYTLTCHLSAVRDFYESSEISDVYYPEVAEVVKALTGATQVTAYTHSVRSASRADAASGDILRPFKVIHNDYTVASGPQRARDALGSNADLLNGRRYSIINVWRPIRGPVADAPLAVCDAQTVAPADLVSTPSQDPSGKFLRIYTLAFNPQQHWSYFPLMHTDEVLLFKTFESKDNGLARFTPHSAFDDPNTPVGAPPRESIEVRTIALFS